MSARIPVCEPHFWGNERRYLNEALDSGWISSAGRFLTAFEERFASFCGVAHGVAVANGTVALHLAVLAAGLKPGDEVIIADFTMISPALAVAQTGAIPVFVDADPRNWTMDPLQVERKITPRTRAIMAVHIYGHPCDMVALGAIAKRHGLKLIEDAAEAHGATVEGTRCGALSDLACFSFYANKIVTTGEGGMVVTNDAQTADHLRSHRNLCLGQGARRFIHEDHGYNYRLTNMQAALGLAQLEHIDEAIARKRAIAAHYDSLLRGVPGLVLPVEETWATNVYWVWGMRVTPEFGMSRDRLMSRLEAQGIETRPFFTGMHAQPAMRSFLRRDEHFPVSRRLGEEGLYLPSFMHLGDAEIERVARAVSEAQGKD